MARGEVELGVLPVSEIPPVRGPRCSANSRPTCKGMWRWCWRIRLRRRVPPPKNSSVHHGTHAALPVIKKKGMER